MPISEDLNPNTTDFQGCLKFPMPLIFRGVSKSKHMIFLFQGCFRFQMPLLQSWCKPETPQWTCWFWKYFSNSTHLEVFKIQMPLDFRSHGIWILKTSENSSCLRNIFQNLLVVGFLVIYNLLFNFFTTLYFASI